MSGPSSTPSPIAPTIAIALPILSSIVASLGFRATSLPTFLPTHHDTVKRYSAPT
jgi:hypothetical protein